MQTREELRQLGEVGSRAHHPKANRRVREALPGIPENGSLETASGGLDSPGERGCDARNACASSQMLNSIGDVNEPPGPKETAHDTDRAKRRPGRRFRTLMATALAAGVTASCAAGRTAEPAGSQLTVFAAASLTDVFPRIDSRPSYSFAGSNTLLQQIQQGAPADVFASANTSYPQQLFAEGTCETPVVYASNRIVVIVPKANPAGIRTVSDLTNPGVEIVIAGVGVPDGDYTRTILRRLGIAKEVMANVVSNETDVKGVASKIALGEADAGFVYRTDVVSVATEVSFVRIPASAQPSVRYSMCVLRSSSNLAAARAFQARVLGPVGRGNLSGALFGLPPKQP